MGVALLVLLFILLPLAGGLWLALFVLREYDKLTRVLIVFAAFAAGAVGFNITFAAASGPVLDWNGAKLAPIIAMVKAEPKEPLYGDRDTGVMSAWIYGPVPALVFLPTALFSRPTGAIVMGVAITIACALPAALWIILRFAWRTDRDTWIIASLLALTFTCVSMDHESLRRAVYMVGPDGPALGLLAGSCLFIMSRRTWATMVGSVACAVLACWCKQSLIPFLIVPPLFVFAVDGFRNAMRYLLLLAPIGLAFSAILVLSFNPSNMWFQMVEISAHHKFQENMYGNVVALWYGVGEWLADAIEPIVLLVFTFLLIALTRNRTVENEPAAGWWSRAQKLARDYPWSILLVAAVVLWPSSILGYVKIGGYYNNFALTNYFLLAAACAALVHQWATIRDAAPRVAKFTRAAACVFVSVKAMNAFITTGTMLLMGQRILNVNDNVQEVIFNFAQKHPGEGFFPWNNLSTLLAERKMYHFEWGLIDRIEAGKTDASLSPTPEQIRRHLPAKLTMIVLPPLFQSWTTHESIFKEYIPAQYLPAYAIPSHWSELDRFVIWVDPARFGFRVQQDAGNPSAAPQQPQPPPASDFDLTPRIRR